MTLLLMNCLLGTKEGNGIFTLVDVSEDNRPPSGGGVTLEDAAVKIQVRQKTASIVTIYVQFNHPRPAGKATR